MRGWEGAPRAGGGVVVPVALGVFLVVLRLSFMAGCECDLKFNSVASSTPSVVRGIEFWPLN